ncbi:beta-alanine transporter-like isoform X4 [Ornithodoros turicata]|uniref:beta-alanine transporter-like isoform X4 n=1 Tax=Ornithodoros turicata TaxID=34597 RepID=UPI003138AECE
MGTSTSPETQRGSSSPDAEDNTGIILGTGYFQRTTLLFASVVALVLGLNDFLPLLAVPEVDYWCASSHQVNVSEGKNMSIPVQENNSQCYMSEGSLEANQSVIPCTAWHYDHTLHYLTAVEEWNLVCNDSWLAPTSTAVYMLGSAVGTAAMGFLSDSIGRKPVSCIGSVATLLLCVAAINTKTIQAFILIRFLSGAAISGTGITIYVLILEVIPTSRRALYAFVMWSGYSCGMTTIRTAEGFHVAWRSVQFGMIIPTALLLFVFAVLEESPRWLISQWDLANAERTILIIAKKNKRKRSDALDTWNKNKVGLELAEENYSSTLKVNLTRVLLTRQLRCSNIILCLSCFAISFTFFSMTFNTEDTLQIVVMGGIVAGIPPDIAAYIGMEHLGRKPTLVIALLLTALSCVAELILRDKDSLEYGHFGPRVILLRGGHESCVALRHRSESYVSKDNCSLLPWSLWKDRMYPGCLLSRTVSSNSSCDALCVVRNGLFSWRSLRYSTSRDKVCPFARSRQEGRCLRDSASPGSPTEKRQEEPRKTGRISTIAELGVPEVVPPCYT